MYYKNLELKAHDATYYEHEVDDNFPLQYDELCEASLAEDMKPLTDAVIKGHPLGKAMIGTYWTPHEVQHTDVLAYAAVTGFEEYHGKQLAVIGGIITLPECRGEGLAIATLEALHDEAAGDEFVSEFGHEGFLARCNPGSGILTEKLDFSQVGQEAGKLLMMKVL